MKTETADCQTILDAGGMIIGQACLDHDVELFEGCVRETDIPREMPCYVCGK